MLQESNPSNLFNTGVSQAVEHINSTIAPALVGQVRRRFSSSLSLCSVVPMWTVPDVFCLSPQDVSVVEQERIDQIMIDLDGTENKCKWS